MDDVLQLRPGVAFGIGGVHLGRTWRVGAERAEPGKTGRTWFFAVGDHIVGSFSGPLAAAAACDAHLARENPDENKT